MRIANVEFKSSGIDLRLKIDDLAIKKTYGVHMISIPT